MSRVGLYCRVSTEEQAERFGLASQLTELRALAARRGDLVAAEFLDEGYSGATLDRPGLQRLREAIGARAIDRVLVLDPDRLARALYLQLLLDQEFSKAGVAVEFASGSYEATPTGRMFYQFKGVIAEYERALIRERTARGRREKARRGLVVASRPAFGYRADPEHSGRLLIHEPEAAVIRMMFRWCAEEQRSIRGIALELTRLGLRPQRGQVWRMSTVRRILTNVLYTGQAYYGQREVAEHPRTGRRTLHRWRPREDWISIPVPAIVTPETLALAEQQLARNRAILVGRPSPYVYLLRGLLRCGTCGRRLAGCPQHGRRFYRCGGRDRLAGAARCRTGLLHADRLEARVWSTVAEVLRRPAVLLTHVERHVAAAGVREIEVRSEADYLAEQLAGLHRQEQKLLDLYLDESLRTEALRERLQALATARWALQERLSLVQRQAAQQGAAEAHQEAVLRFCATARRGLSRLNRESRQRLLRTLIDEIVVRRAALEIHGILPAGEELTTPAARCGRRRPRSRERAWRGPARARRPGRGRRRPRRSRARAESAPCRGRPLR